MARIPLRELDQLGEEESATYDRLPINLTRALLRTKCAADYLALGLSLWEARLAPKLRELVVLRVAALSRCRYEWMHHVAAARKAGWTDADIAAIEAGDAPHFDACPGALLRFVDECVRDVRVSNDTFARLSGWFGEDEIAEATLITGFYMMTARFLETLDVDLDDEVSGVLLTSLD